MERLPVTSDQLALERGELKWGNIAEYEGS